LHVEAHTEAVSTGGCDALGMLDAANAAASRLREPSSDAASRRALRRRSVKHDLQSTWSTCSAVELVGQPQSAMRIGEPS